jgi:NAD(P)H-hydrate epimerase
MKLVSVAQMRAIEEEANAHGLSYDTMMQNAGEGLAQVILNEFKDEADGLNVVGLIGSGNNGGDTLIALAVLVEAGWAASAYITGSRPTGDPLVQNLLKQNVQVIHSEEDLGFEVLDDLLSEADVLLDGVLGTGFKLPLRPELAQILGHVAGLAKRTPVIAVDCPSGVDCDSGDYAPETISATLTVCMAAVKQGLLRFPAFEKIGQLQVVPIGMPDDLKSMAQIQYHVVTQAQTAAILPERPKSAHKGTFGSALVVAGSINYTGAAYLAAKAAYRVGTGLVRLAVPGPLHTALAGQLPEVTWLILPHDMGVISEAAAEVVLKNLEKTDAILIGPGFGMEDTTGAFIKHLLSPKSIKSSLSAAGIGFRLTTSPKDEAVEAEPVLPGLVIDADGLKLLAKLPNWSKQLPPLSILTPHPGEMAILTGLKIEEIQADRLETAMRFANEWQQVVVLKGALTVIAAPGQGAYVVPVATAALARAGTGDVLAGIIVGLLAQGVTPLDAAVAGVWIHAHAGLEAESFLATTASVLASDVLEAIPSVLSQLEKN